MLIPQYQVLVLKLSPIYTVSLNTVFSIPQNQCYPGTTARCFQVFSSLTVNIARPQCVQFIYLVIQPISTVVTIIVVPKVSVQ